MSKKIEEFRKNLDFNKYITKVSGSKDKIWVENKLKKVFSGKLIKDNKGFIHPGKIYLFMYDPQNKSSLPIWDRFPLVFVTESNRHYIKGLNLHYIFNMQQRQYLIESIIKKDSKPITKDYFVQINRSGSSGVITKAMIDKMYRVYLRNRLKSYILVIPATEWVNALNLPLGQFIIQ